MAGVIQFKRLTDMSFSVVIISILNSTIARSCRRFPSDRFVLQSFRKFQRQKIIVRCCSVRPSCTFDSANIPEPKHLVLVHAKLLQRHSWPPRKVLGLRHHPPFGHPSPHVP